MNSNLPFRRVALASGMLLGCASLSFSQVTLESTKIISSDVEAGDYFGIDVSVDGDRMLVGSGKADVGTDPTSDEGLAYIYDWNGSAWVESAILSGAGINPLAEFGHRVDLQGDTAVVGAPGLELIDPVTMLPIDEAGGAFVFEFDGLNWNQVAVLTAEVPEAEHEFGASVAIDQDRIVVGAPGAEVHHEISSALDGVGEGLAYVFLKDAVTGVWEQEADFGASDATIGFEFGASVDVDMSRDRLIVGSDHAGGPNGEINAGAIYVFELDGTGAWVEVDRLTPPNARAYDHTGENVSLSGDRIIAGAKFNDTLSNVNSNEGKAYVWHLTDGVWNLEGAFASASTRAGDLFGSRVAIEGDIAVIGSNRFDVLTDPNSDEGTAYVFAFDGTDWVELEQLGASDATPGAQFGRAVSIDGQRILVGSSGDDNGLLQAGGVYEYARDPNLGVATSYNGSGINDEALRSDNRPIVGVDWEAQIDTQDFPLAAQSLLFVYAGQLQLVLPQGELLVDVTSSFYGASIALSVSGQDDHAITIPNDPALLGLSAFVQGVIGDGSLHLLNAYALTLGQ